MAAGLCFVPSLVTMRTFMSSLSIASASGGAVVAPVAASSLSINEQIMLGLFAEDMSPPPPLISIDRAQSMPRSLGGGGRGSRTPSPPS